MGKLNDWRDFLNAIAPQCFFNSLEDGFYVDAYIIDSMQHIVPVFQNSQYPNFDPAYLLRHISQVTGYYTNAERSPKRPIVNVMTVMLLDTPQHVPKNKAATQKERDKTQSHVDETLYHKLVEERGGNYEDLFIDYEKDMTCTIPCAVVRRSVNLNFQLYRLLTHHLIKTTKVPENQVIIIDGGIAISTERFTKVREAIIHDNQWHDRSFYEQECLVHHFLNEARYYTRYTLYANEEFNRFIPNDKKEIDECIHDIGEADIKIQRYITPHNGLKRYIIASQDTDILFILLLHMCYFLGEHTKDEIDTLEIWLNTDASMGFKDAKSYRYINIKALYFAIIDLFAKEFPSIFSPIETFIFLVFSLKTDFTLKFHSCLNIGPAMVWNTFASLHASNGLKDGFIRFGNVLKRSGNPIKKLPLTNILSSAVRYDYSNKTFQLDYKSVSQFYYFLCQGALLSVRSKLKLPVNPVQTLISPYELQLYAKEIMERLYYYEKGSLPLNIDNNQDITMNMIFDNPALSSLIYEENEMKEYIKNNKDALACVLKKKPPSLYGIPTQEEMKRRILQRVWYMNYCRDGWSSRHVASSFINYGWQEIKEEDEGLINSTTNDVQYIDGKFQFFKVVEEK